MLSGQIRLARVQKELDTLRLCSFAQDGFVVDGPDDDMQQCSCRMTGPEGSRFQSQTFTLSINLGQRYAQPAPTHPLTLPQLPLRTAGHLLLHAPAAPQH